jgi:hypothetical protein
VEKLTLAGGLRLIPACPGRKGAQRSPCALAKRRRASQGLPKNTPPSLKLTVLDSREENAPGRAAGTWLLLTSSS